MSDTQTSANHLINEKSPYLLQHAYNPVGWYPFLTDHVQSRLWLVRELLGAKTAICGQEVRITGIGG